jgi:hypothetical protein
MQIQQIEMLDRICACQELLMKTQTRTLRLNYSLAETIWGELTPALLQGLEDLTKRYGLSVALGIYFKLYKSQLPVVDQALETAALMLGTNKSRGYCLEMICADFLAGASLESGDQESLIGSLSRVATLLPEEMKLKLAEKLR